MKIKSLFVAVVSVLSPSLVFGQISELDFRYWYDASLPLPGGWTHYKLNKGTLDGVWKGGAYFDSMEDWLLSPAFDMPIRSVTLYVATSTEKPTRTLYLHPIYNGVTNETGSAFLSTTNQVYVEQSVLFGTYEVNQFVLKLVGSENKGNWGMERIVIRYGDESTNDGEDPPRSWSVAEIVRKSGWREADFSILQHVAAEVNTPWRNGVTIDGFHAFLAGEACVKINLASGPTPKNAGLYALDMAEGEGMVRTIALNCSGKKAMSLMLPVALDAKRAVARLSVSYRVRGLPDEMPEAMTLSYRILDDLKQMTDANAEWKPLAVAVDAKTVRIAKLFSDDLHGGSHVCFRWHMPKRENCPAIGISDVRVSAELEPSGFAVIVK